MSEGWTGANFCNTLKNNELRFQQKYNDYSMSKKELAEWLKLFGEESDQSEDDREFEN